MRLHSRAHVGIEYRFKQGEQRIGEALHGAHGLTGSIHQGFIGAMPSPPNVGMGINQPSAAADGRGWLGWG
jgi:hypothetical protein